MHGVLLRALEEQGVLKSVSGQIAIGWLIVEDLVTVIILVLLPVLASALGGVDGDSAGRANGSGQLLLALGIVLGKFVGFVLFMLLVGACLLPWLLDTRRRHKFAGSCSLLPVVAYAAIGIGFGAAELIRPLLCPWRVSCRCCCGRVRPQSSGRGRVEPLQMLSQLCFLWQWVMLFDPSIVTRQPLHLLAVVAVLVLGISACVRF